MSVEQMVKHFHGKFGHPVGGPPEIASDQRMALRRSLIDEEVEELYEACEEHDIVGIADALADLVYVAVGMAVELGIPFDEVFFEVHRSNFSKLGSDGKPIYRSDGKVMKGPDWTPPNIKHIMERRKTVFGMHVDPVPGMYPKCVCGSECEWPCWQQRGLVPDEDIGACCGCNA